MASRREGGRTRQPHPSFHSYIGNDVIMDMFDGSKVQSEKETAAKSRVPDETGDPNNPSENADDDTSTWVCLHMDSVIPDRQINDDSTSKPEDQELGMAQSENKENASGTDSENILCGYLLKYKLGTRGFNRTFKRRWFVFSEDSCKLLYYRTPQDMVPLGEICISCATFLFDVQNTDRKAMFEIRSKGSTYLLEAPDKHTMLYWLQELQKKRRQFSKKKTRLTLEKSTQQAKKEVPKEGLLGDEVEVSQGEEKEEEEEVGSEGGTEYSAPHTVGSQSASKHSSTGSSFRDISISNWRTELRNKFAQWKSPRQSKLEMSTTWMSPSTSQQDIGVADEESENGANDIASSSSSQPRLSRTHTVTEKLTHIKNKLTRSKSSHSDVYNDMDDEGRCDMLSTELQQQKEENSLLEEELEATREIVRGLNKQVDKLEQQLITQENYHQSCGNSEESTSSKDASLQMLHDRDSQIVDLQQQLISSQHQCSLLQSRLKCCENEVAGLQEEISMYSESITAKDTVVITLTHRLTELERLHGESENALIHANTSTNNAPLPSARDLEKIRDENEGFKQQNQLLNGELLQLAQLRAEDEARELEMQQKYTELEAKFYQVRSKWLLCLKEISQPTLSESGGRSQELVCQLLDDAINTEASFGTTPASTKTKVVNSFRKPLIVFQCSGVTYAVQCLHKAFLLQEPQYDIYGFPHNSRLEENVWDEEELEARAHSFLRKHDELSNQAKEAEKEISVQVKWENYMVSVGNRPLQQTAELKNLIRAGVPVKYRNKVWKACVEWRVKRLKECYSGNYYEGTLALARKMLGTSLNPIERQIEVDLLRTLPENRHYQCLSSDGIPQLRRVLLAYAVHNPEIGYCQGLNRIAAIALLFLGEEDSFWCLVAIVESLLSTDHYSKTLMASHVDQRVLKDLVADKLPKLAAHFETYRVDMSLFTFNWFMTIYIDNVPVETFLRVWDTFLYEGVKVLFRFAVAFLKHQEENLLKCDSDLKLHGALRELGNNMTDINMITQIAFQELNPFPIKTIHSRRAFHSQIIKHEMERFETMKQALESTSSSQPEYTENMKELGFSDEDLE